MKIKSAVRTHISGVTAGITQDDKTVIFLTRQYDNDGYVEGHKEIISDDKEAFYFLGYTCNHKPVEEQEKFVCKALSFKRKHP